MKDGSFEMEIVPGGARRVLKQSSREGNIYVKFPSHDRTRQRRVSRLCFQLDTRSEDNSTVLQGLIYTFCLIFYQDIFHRNLNEKRCSGVLI